MPHPSLTQHRIWGPVCEGGHAPVSLPSPRQQAGVFGVSYKSRNTISTDFSSPKAKYKAESRVSIRSVASRLGPLRPRPHCAPVCERHGRLESWPGTPIGICDRSTEVRAFATCSPISSLPSQSSCLYKSPPGRARQCWGQMPLSFVAAGGSVCHS